jgi:hypothetical protein
MPCLVGFGWMGWVDGVVGVCVWLVWVDNPIGCMVWCVGGCIERWWEMWICMQTPLLSLLLNLVLSVEKVTLPIEDLMVDGGCIATTGGRRLFCIYLNRSRTYECTDNKYIYVFWSLLCYYLWCLNFFIILIGTNILIVIIVDEFFFYILMCWMDIRRSRK